MKKTLLKCQFLCFFHNIGPNLVQILLQRPQPLSSLFADFQWNMLGDSININNLCCNPVVLKKKIGKISKKLLFWAKFVQKRGHYGQLPKWKTIFLGRNTKNRSSAFRNFLFYQNVICFGWVINFFPSWVMFFVKKSVISS